MKQIFKLSMFTLVGAMIIMAAFGAPPVLALGISAAVNYASFNLVHVPAGFGFEWITAGQEFNGKENEEILFRPRFSGKVEDIGFRQILTKNTDGYKLTFFGALGKILMPYVKGFQGGNGAPIAQKKLTLAEFKAETAYDKHDYFGIVQEQMVNNDGVAQNDISGTTIMAAEQKVFMDAIVSDVYRNVWLGDTAKVHTAAGTYPDGTAYALGAADKYYNQIDGIITQIRAVADTAPTENEIKLTNITAGGITTGEARDVMKPMFRNAPKVLQNLKNVGRLRYYATDSVIFNYLDDLEADGTEAARMQTINGMPVPTFDNIPIVPLNIDSYISTDFAAAFPKDMIILTTPENMAMVLNAAGSWAETRFWFNPDENENRQRTQFHLGAGFVLPELISFAQNG